MSVIVKGMEMPVMCSCCDFTYYGQGDDYANCYCSITNKEIDYITRHPDCPLVDVRDDDRGHAMSAINREDALEAILSRLMETEEPTPPWIFSVIRKCLDDLPSLPSTEPLVHDGFYLCDKKPGACPSWERKGWTKCESKHCNRTSRVDHALKLPDDGWIPYTGHDQNIEYGRYLVQTKESMVCATYGFGGFMFPFYVERIVAFRPLPKPYEPKEG